MAMQSMDTREVLLSLLKDAELRNLMLELAGEVVERGPARPTQDDSFVRRSDETVQQFCVRLRETNKIQELQLDLATAVLLLRKYETLFQGLGMNMSLLNE